MLSGPDRPALNSQTFIQQQGNTLTFLFFPMPAKKQLQYYVAALFKFRGNDTEKYTA